MNAEFAWGIKGVNDTDIDLWDPDRFGSIIWDEEFDPTLFESLDFLKDFCND